MGPAEAHARTRAPACARASREVCIRIHAQGAARLPRHPLDKAGGSDQEFRQAAKSCVVALTGHRHASAKLLGRKGQVEAVHGEVVGAGSGSAEPTALLGIQDPALTYPCLLLLLAVKELRDGENGGHRVVRIIAGVPTVCPPGVRAQVAVVSDGNFNSLSATEGNRPAREAPPGRFPCCVGGERVSPLLSNMTAIGAAGARVEFHPPTGRTRPARAIVRAREAPPPSEGPEEPAEAESPRPGTRPRGPAGPRSGSGG